MIRTALTLSICARDAQDTSYLVNGTLLGMLSSASQQTHVQTNNRQLQLVVAIKNDDIGSPASLVKHQQMVSAWKDFQHIWARKRSSNLSSLLKQYHLLPDWLICIDDQRLQAWLPAKIGFYMLRNGKLTRLLPITPHDTVPSAEDIQPESRQYYSFILNQKDQFYLLPPAIQNFFDPGEVAELLHGMRQLPVKVSELFSTAHLRGFGEENSWLGLQISRLEEDQLPIAKPPLRLRLHLLAWLIKKPRKIESDESVSEAVGPAEAELSDQPQIEKSAGLFKTITANRWLPYYLVAGMGLLLILIGIILFYVLPGLKPLDSNTEPSTSLTNNLTETTTIAVIVTETLPSATTGPPDLIVTAVKLNLRAEPSREALLLTTLVKNDKLYKLGEPADGWVNVRTMDGKIGYVYLIYVTEPTIVG